MGSLAAMEEGSADRYFQEASDAQVRARGNRGRVPYKGPAADTLYQLIGGLRSGMGYLGCPDVETLRMEPSSCGSRAAACANPIHTT